MTTVLPDLAREAKANSSETLQVIYRIFMVSKLPTASPSAMTLLAQTATDSVTGLSIPAMYSVHPNKPEAYVSNINAETLGGNTFLVTVVYKYQIYPSQFLMSFRGGIRAVQRYTDYAGNPIQIPSANLQKDYSFNNGTYVFQGGTAPSGPYVGSEPAMYPVGVTVFRFLEALNPIAINTSYGGCTNSVAWLGAAAGTLRFDGATGETQNLLIYRNEYQFTYDANGFNEVLVQPSQVLPGAFCTNSIPANVGLVAGPGPGYNSFQMRPPVDFNTIFTSAGWKAVGSSDIVFS